jgi:hypothetical protein
MRYLILSFIFFFSGCASVQMPGYISRVDHHYHRKIYTTFEKIVSSTMFVLKNKGWTIVNEVDPSIYERDNRYDNNGYQNLLIMTNVKKRFYHLTGMRLNVFIHSMANTSDVEIRYEAKTSLVKQFISAHNDRVVEDILDAVEKDLTE